MTNFEKWVATLTPELVAAAFNKDDEDVLCEICPLKMANIDCVAWFTYEECSAHIFAYFAEEVAE